MSALAPKADMCSALAHVRFGPKADTRCAGIGDAGPDGAGAKIFNE